MTDQSNEQADLTVSVKELPIPEGQTSNIQLEYPHLLLQTSLESLLTCSYPSVSSHDSIKMATSPHRHLSLDESWASLDTEDFSHDEETHSESADNISLLDIPSTEDEESVIEDDIQNEISLVEDSIHPPSEELKYSKSISNHRDSEATEDDSYPMNDTIVLLPSTYDPKSSKINLSLKQSNSSSNEKVSRLYSHGISCETIHMSVARSKLDSSARPFHVGYYSTPSAQVTRSEVLSKVGSALVAARSTESSTTYHIAPSEFDADLKPRSAELVPSDAQMFVEDVTIVKSREEPTQSGNIEIAFKDGTIIRSRPSSSLLGSSYTIWRPDLLLIHISYEDSRYDTREIEQLLKLSVRHNIPVLMVANESVCENIPVHDFDALHKILEWEDHKGASKTPVSAPIDLESFIRLDSEQLNRHIRFLIDRAQEESVRAVKASTQAEGLLGKLGLMSDSFLGYSNKGWIQEEVNIAHNKSQPHETKMKTFSARSQLWSTLIGVFRSWPLLIPVATSLLIGIVFMVAITMHYSHPRVKTIEQGPLLICGSSGKTTPTTQVAIATRSTLHSRPVSSAATSDVSQNDILAYFLGPNSVQRYIGDAISGRDQDARVSAVSVRQLSTSEVAPVLSKVHSAIEKVRNDVQVKLEQAQERLKDQSFPPPTDLWNRHRETLEKLQEDAKLTLDLVANNIQILGKRSRRRFFEMVEKNQALLARSREATEGQLGDIMREQKKMLAAAQHQAHKLVTKAHEARKGMSVGRN